MSAAASVSGLLKLSQSRGLGKDSAGGQGLRGIEKPRCQVSLSSFPFSLTGIWALLAILSFLEVLSYLVTKKCAVYLLTSLARAS